MTAPLQIFRWFTASGFAPSNAPVYDAHATPLEKAMGTHKIQGDRFCVAADQWIYTPDGVKKADALKEGDRILGGTIRNLTSFEDDIYELRAYKTRFKANGGHPIWTRKRNSCARHPASSSHWTTIKELYEHTTSHTNHWRVKCLTASSFDPWHTGNSIGGFAARLMGYLMSDGYWSETQSVKFTNIRTEFIEDVEKMIRPVSGFYGWNISPKRYHKGQAIDLTLTGKHGMSTSRLKDFLRALGVINRDTLGLIQSLPKEELRQFVCGFFNGDGTLDLHEYGRSRFPIISFAVGLHEQIAYEFQFILWRLDVTSTVKHIAAQNSTAPQFIVSVCGVESVKTLLSMLDWTKYPERFRKAWNKVEHAGNKNNRHPKDEEGRWLPITEVKKVGRGRVIGWETEPSHLIIGPDGLKTHNTGKSALGETIGYLYLVTGGVLWDIYAANDQENAAWLDSDWAPRVTLLTGSNCKLEMRYKQYRQARAVDVNPADPALEPKQIFVACKRFFQTEEDYYRAMWSLSHRFKSRTSYDRVDCIFMREAQEVVTGIKAAGAARTEKDAMTEFMKFHNQLFHFGYSVILDSQRDVEISKSVRELADWNYFKNMGGMEIPRRFWHTFPNADPDRIYRELPPWGFIIYTKGKLGFGVFKLPPWHIERGKDILDRLGIKEHFEGSPKDEMAPAVMGGIGPGRPRETELRARIRERLKKGESYSTIEEAEHTSNKTITRVKREMEAEKSQTPSI